MKNNINKIRNDQRGVASIIVVTIIILILTLVVLAMARNANREQRQALDRQLSSSAFYAAESGINDTVEYIRKNLSGAPKDKKSCETDQNKYPGFPNGELGDLGSSTSLIKYSCVLYDQNPTSLQYNVGSDSTIIPIQDSESNGISSLTFEWQNSEGGTNSTGCPANNSTTLPEIWFNNCDFGMLRIEAIDPNNLNRNGLINSDTTFFAVPSNSGSGTAQFSNGKNLKQGAFGYAICSNSSGTNKCSLTIRNIGLSGDSQMFLRVRSLYKPSTLTITGNNNVASRGSVKFLNAQVMVDATGKANDVLRRLQVRVPVRPQYDYPNFAIEATDGICKKIDIYPGQTSPADNCSY